MIEQRGRSPAVRGPITSNPDTGEPYTSRSRSSASRQPGERDDRLGKLHASPDGSTAVARRSHAREPELPGFASFCSGGPRTGDSCAQAGRHGSGRPSSRPASAPATGRRSSPARRWPRRTTPASRRSSGRRIRAGSGRRLKAAIVNTADPSLSPAYYGSGSAAAAPASIQPAQATQTQVVASRAAATVRRRWNFGLRGAEQRLHEGRSHQAATTSARRRRRSPSRTAMPQGSPHCGRPRHDVGDGMARHKGDGRRDAERRRPRRPVTRAAFRRGRRPRHVHARRGGANNGGIACACRTTSCRVRRPTSTTKLERQAGRRRR